MKTYTPTEQKINVIETHIYQALDASRAVYDPSSDNSQLNPLNIAQANAIAQIATTEALLLIHHDLQELITTLFKINDSRRHG